MTTRALSLGVFLLAALVLGLSGGQSVENARPALKQDAPRPDDQPADMSKPVHVFNPFKELYWKQFGGGPNSGIFPHPH